MDKSIYQKVYDETIRQRIRERAYQIYESRKEFDCLFICDNRGDLREVTAQDDWLESEKEILAKLNMCN